TKTSSSSRRRVRVGRQRPQPVPHLLLRQKQRRAALDQRHRGQPGAPALPAPGAGWVGASQARRGKKAWVHKVRKRGLNGSVLVDGGRIYACHSEENLQGSRMGAVVCIDASSGKPKEVWRIPGVESGFGSPTIHDGILYVIDNSARVHAIDTKTGKELW